MKRFFLTWCALCALASTEAQYRIYAYKGAVEYKSKVSGVTLWTPVSENQSLAGSDSIRIPKGALVRIEHIKPRTIYTSFRQGASSVASIIEAAKSENARHIFNGINREMATVRTKAPEKNPMNVLGSSSRAMGKEEDNTEQIAESFVWIGALAAAGSPAEKAEGLSLKKHLVNGEWAFEMVNATGKDCYLNVLHINRLTNTVSLCYVLTPDSESNGCLLTQSGFSTYTPDLFFPNTENDLYVLVATEEPYDSYAVDNELSFLSTAQAQPALLTIQYTW